MINVYPLSEEELHKMDNLCNCNPSVLFENGSMIVIHNLIIKPLNEVINDNTESLFQLYLDGFVTEIEISNILTTAIEDEEYEVAVSIKDVLSKIKALKDAEAKEV